MSVGQPFWGLALAFVRVNSTVVSRSVGAAVVAVLLHIVATGSFERMVWTGAAGDALSGFAPGGASTVRCFARLVRQLPTSAHPFLVGSKAPLEIAKVASVVV